MKHNDNKDSVRGENVHDLSPTARPNRDGYDVQIIVPVQGDTETEAATVAHDLLVRYGLEAGSVQIKPSRTDEPTSTANLDFMFEPEPKASLDFLFEEEE